MTEEQINIVIAESLGWKRDNRGLGWLSPSGEYADPQNYTASLDACAEFEAKLDNCCADDRSLYLDHLALACGWPEAKSHAEAVFESHYRSVRSKAPQRCEAYLRTIGKWVDALDQFKRDLDDKLKSMSPEELKAVFERAGAIFDEKP